MLEVTGKCGRSAPYGIVNGRNEWEAYQFTTIWVISCYVSHIMTMRGKSQ